MCKWTLEKENQITEALDIENLKIFKLPDKPLYHYSSRETLWKILDSDTMLARHIMFSNDKEENKIGTSKIKAIFQKNSITADYEELLPFMICFCEEKDLLSQWRGYAKEGVAIELDFSKGLYDISKEYENEFSPYHCFTIMNNEECKKTGQEYFNEFSVLNAGKKEQKKVFVGTVAAPYEVLYADAKLEDERIEKYVNKIKKARPEDAVSKAMELIPYIKNDKFKEEKEYRLIFNMKKLLQENDQQILNQKYIYIEESGVRKPNIRVRFGDQAEMENNEKIKIYYHDDGLKVPLNELRKELEEKKICIESVKNETKLGTKEIFISSGKFQEEICALLRTRLWQLETYGGKEKVWCGGHLPIRRIYVGPSKDADYMASSIKEYIKTKYWLRDIEVKLSEIPLRT